MSGEAVEVKADWFECTQCGAVIPKSHIDGVSGHAVPDVDEFGDVEGSKQCGPCEPLFRAPTDSGLREAAEKVCRAHQMAMEENRSPKNYGQFLTALSWEIAGLRAVLSSTPTPGGMTGEPEKPRI